jgi:glycosyltransferase involved in cell wall biosynthesis
MRMMNVFIHASIEPEPFGMVLLEAMLYKVPVIATNLGGPIEILEKGRYGILVPPRDVDAIVAGVEKYLSNSTFREDVVEKAQKRVIEAFDQRKTVEIVEELFHEAVANSNRTGKSLRNA